MLQEIIDSATVPDPMVCPPLRWGILGPGGIARTFATAVRATGTSVAAVGSRSQEKAQQFAQEFGIPQACGSYEELVGRADVDAIYIATPHSENHANALLAIGAGKPVLIEKAFARSAFEAREIVDAAAEAGVFAMEAMWSRFLPHMVAARKLVAEGAIGTVNYVSADHCQTVSHVPRLAQLDLAGGALLDLGVYPISFIHSLLGVPEAISATGSLSQEGCDASSATALTYPGALAVASTSMMTRSPTRAWIGGTEGYIDFDPQFYRDSGFEVVRHDGERARFAPTLRAGGFEYEIAEVSRCISSGQCESATFPLRDTVQVIQIMDEVRRQLAVCYPGEIGAGDGSRYLHTFTL